MALLFVFLGLEQLYKSYLWIILGVCLFSIINLTLWSLQDTGEEMMAIKRFFYNHREFFAYISLFFIPFFALALPLNQSVEFRIGKRLFVKIFASFFFGVVYVSFLLSIFLSIVQNRFFFSIDEVLIAKIQSWFLFETINTYLSPSVIYQWLLQYDYIISFVMILYIFYKMTIWGIVDALLLFLLNLLKKVLESQKNTSAEKHDTGKIESDLSQHH